MLVGLTNGLETGENPISLRPSWATSLFMPIMSLGRNCSLFVLPYRPWEQTNLALTEGSTTRWLKTQLSLRLFPLLANPLILLSFPKPSRIQALGRQDSFSQRMTTQCIRERYILFRKKAFSAGFSLNAQLTMAVYLEEGLFIVKWTCKVAAVVSYIFFSLFLMLQAIKKGNCLI